jgi:hypothetical protein
MQVAIRHINVICRNELEGGIAKGEGGVFFGKRFFEFLDPDVYQRDIQKAFSQASERV